MSKANELTVSISLESLIEASRKGIEIWRVIPEHANYEASTLGQIRNRSNNRILKACDITGTARIKYQQVRLCGGKTGKSVTKSVHRLVATTFFGPHPDLSVDHLNEVKSDCRLCNIEFVSQKENQDRWLKRHRAAKASGWAKPAALALLPDAVAKAMMRPSKRTAERMAKLLKGSSKETVTQRMYSILFGDREKKMLGEFQGLLDGVVRQMGSV